MNSETHHVRLLPSTGAHAKPCLLLTDGDGAVSRLADRIEDAQLGLAERLLGRARRVIAAPGLSHGELSELTAQLTEALHDALLIAECRNARIGTAEPLGPGLGGRCRVLGGEQEPVLAPVDAEAFALLTFPGRDLASAGTARRRVRATARSWGLPSSVADDLETIAGELVANALEHSGSHTITVSCTLSGRSATISVTDEGGGGGRVPMAPTEPPRPEQEGGRGLLITDALAHRWGTRRAADGHLTVWATVTVTLEPSG